MGSLAGRAFAIAWSTAVAAAAAAAAVASVAAAIATAFIAAAIASPAAHAQPAARVVDLPTRPGVSQRLLVLTPPQPRAAVILFAGGSGGLRIGNDGTPRLGGNFLVRSRELFARHDLVVAVIDAPSDRQAPLFLQGFRQTGEHAADVRAVIAWLRDTTRLPVWLVGTSRGTQSAAYVATELAPPDGPDGVVLTSTIVVDRRGRPVPAMPLDRIRVPVLLVHHEQDGCVACPFADVPALLGRLRNALRKELVAMRGGLDQGDPCEAFAHHGFNGLEREVVGRIADWILGR